MYMRVMEYLTRSHDHVSLSEYDSAHPYEVIALCEL